jgi:hypothetical protein
MKKAIQSIKSASTYKYVPVILWDISARLEEPSNPDLKKTYKQAEQTNKTQTCPETLDTGHTNGITEVKFETPHVAKKGIIYWIH